MIIIKFIEDLISQASSNLITIKGIHLGAKEYKELEFEMKCAQRYGQHDGSLEKELYPITYITYRTAHGKDITITVRRRQGQKSYQAY